MKRSALVAFLAISVALTACSEESRDAIRSRVSDAVGSASISPSLPSLPSRSEEGSPSEEPSRQPTPSEEPTEEPSPTEEPTEEPTPEPSEEPSPTEEPTSATGATGASGPTGPTRATGPTGPTAPTEGATPSGAAQADTGFPWPWILLVLAAVVVVAALLLRRASAGKARDAWRTRARSIQTDALALRDRVATELPVLRSGGEIPAIARAEVETSFGALGASLQQLQADAPDGPSRTAAQDLFLASEAVRSSLQLSSQATGDDVVRRGIAETLDERLAGLDASIARFGASIDPDRPVASGGPAGT